MWLDRVIIKLIHFTGTDPVVASDKGQMKVIIGQCHQ